MNKERLLNVVKALRESPNPEKFSMCHVHNSCGSPACAIGHYVARSDLQSEFLPVPVDHPFMLSNGTGHVLLKDGTAVFFSSNALLNHFELGDDEFDDLFSDAGCNWAHTADQAADYIERFVATAE